MPDVIVLLQRDHQSAERLLSRVDGLTNAQAAEYFCELREALVRHEVAEELVIYPAFREKVPLGGGVADARLAEQAAVGQELARLEHEDTSSASFLTQLRELRAAVLAHASQEESEVFPPLKAALRPSELEQLGEHYEKALASAPTHPHPHVPQTPPGNTLLEPLAALIDHLRDAMRSSPS